MLHKSGIALWKANGGKLFPFSLPTRLFNLYTRLELEDKISYALFVIYKAYFETVWMRQSDFCYLTLSIYSTHVLLTIDERA